ncbi:MAG: MMPL family transporter [Hyphomicrobiales bacterium]
MTGSDTGNEAPSSDPGAGAATGVFARLAGFAIARPALTIAIYFILAALGLVLTLTKLEVDTDPGRMISNDLEFRKHFADLNKTFPQFDNVFAVVIDAESSEKGRETARTIAAAFKKQPDLFSHVYAPGTEPFYDEFGILYLELEEVAGIVYQIGQTRPLFLTLASSPNLSGMEQLFDLILLGAETGELPGDAKNFLAEASRTLDGQAVGKPHNFDWEGLQPQERSDAPMRWFVLIKPILDFTALEPAEKPLQEAKRILANPEVNPLGPEKVRLTGEAAVNAEELSSVTQGAALAGIISFCLVTLVVFFGMPYRRLIVPIIIMLIVGILIDAGFATLAIGHLNMISVAFAVLFIGLGIDYAVHFVLRFSEAIQNGVAFEQAVTGSAAAIGPALFLCTLTTTLAFLVFSVTDFVGMAQLGVIAAGGIVIAFMASLTLIPALLFYIRPPAGAANKKALVSLPEGLSKAWPGLRTMVAGGVFLAAAIAITIIPQVRFDGDPINLKDPDAPSVVVFNDLIKTNPELIYAAQIIVGDDQKPDALASELAKLDTVKQVNNVEKFLPANQPAKIGELAKLGEMLPPTPSFDGDIGDEARRQSVANTVAILDKLAVQEDAPADIQAEAKALAGKFRSLEGPGKEKQVKQLEGAFMANARPMFDKLHGFAKLEPVASKALPESIYGRYVAPDGRVRLEVVPVGNMRNEPEMKAFVTSISKLAPNVTGAPVEITGAAATVADAMRTAGLLALALVFALLFFILRKIWDVGLVLLPILLSALLLLGYTVLFDAPFNFANIIVFPLLLGLGVDSSIHYVMRLREGGYGERIDNTSTPRAVLLSALTTIGSFGTLWLSQHLGLSSMGELLTVSIACTLVCTLIVLPEFVQWTAARADRMS